MSKYETTLPVEGPLWLLDYVVKKFSDQKQREQFLKLAFLLEVEPSLTGSSAHLLAVARKV